MDSDRSTITQVNSHFAHCGLLMLSCAYMRMHVKPIIIEERDERFYA